MLVNNNANEFRLSFVNETGRSLKFSRKIERIIKNDKERLKHISEALKFREKWKQRELKKN